MFFWHLHLPATPTATTTPFESVWSKYSPCSFNGYKSLKHWLFLHFGQRWFQHSSSALSQTTADVKLSSYLGKVQSFWWSVSISKIKVVWYLQMQAFWVNCDMNSANGGWGCVNSDLLVFLVGYLFSMWCKPLVQIFVSGFFAFCFTQPSYDHCIIFNRWFLWNIMTLVKITRITF